VALVRQRTIPTDFLHSRNYIQIILTVIILSGCKHPHKVIFTVLLYEAC
jgi:hypothetical protein